MADFVFGYGSLLERASQTNTNPDAVGTWPTRVTDAQRAISATTPPSPAGTHCCQRCT